jgi:hypothetical protein
MALVSLCKAEENELDLGWTAGIEMLNVATSRPRERLILFGDFARWRNIARSDAQSAEYQAFRHMSQFKDMVNLLNISGDIYDWEAVEQWKTTGRQEGLVVERKDFSIWFATHLTEFTAKNKRSISTKVKPLSRYDKHKSETPQYMDDIAGSNRNDRKGKGKGIQGPTAHKDITMADAEQEDGEIQDVLRHSKNIQTAIDESRKAAKDDELRRQGLGSSASSSSSRPGAGSPSYSAAAAATAATNPTPRPDVYRPPNMTPLVPGQQRQQQPQRQQSQGEGQNLAGDWNSQKKNRTEGGQQQQQQQPGGRRNQTNRPGRGGRR